MNHKWPTKNKDMQVARNIINEYTSGEGLVGIFEVVKKDNPAEVSIHLAEWVVILTQYFRELYGIEHGDFVMKKVLSACLINGQTIH